MIRKVMFLSMLMFVLCAGALLAQEAEAPIVEIDIAAEIEIAMSIFLVGIGGMSVTALTSVLKRMLKADGLAVIAISVVVSAGIVGLYLVPIGFILWKFVLLTVIVALAANGIYLTPQKRND